MKQWIAIDNVCAWPNLQVLNDGVVAAIIYNQPNHGLSEGSLECWTSKDSGASWSLSGIPAPAPKGQNRMHISAGVDEKGDLLVISSGFETTPDEKTYGAMQRMWFSRSSDNGKTWTIDRDIEIIDNPKFTPNYCIPHGRILTLSDGSLGATFYQGSTVWLSNSSDGGHTWTRKSTLDTEDGTEAVIYKKEEGGLYAVGRTFDDHHVDLYESSNDYKTWTRLKSLTGPMQHPADLTLLKNGNLLLTYGIRHKGSMGVGARRSEDGGKTWKSPWVLTNLGKARDCGYPSTVQLKTGEIVTAYYTDHVPNHHRYHMGVLQWELEDFI